MSKERVVIRGRMGVGGGGVGENEGREQEMCTSQKKRGVREDGCKLRPEGPDEERVMGFLVGVPFG